jgi:DNA adenine methylase
VRDVTKNSERSIAGEKFVPFGSLNLFPDTELAETAGARPFLRWAGGKTRLLRYIAQYVPPRIRSYHEPFLGSGAMFFHVRGRVRESTQLADLNKELINTWLVVRDQPAPLLKAVAKYLGMDSEKEYYRIREAATPSRPVQRAARFLYLNQTAWNGLWRENKFGVFNVPWGARPFKGLDRGSLETVSRALQDVVISNRDWRESLELPRAGDFVYIDPPYLPVSDTSKFSGYNGTRFRAADLAELAGTCEKLSERGVYWMLSNRDTHTVRTLFAHSKIVRFTTRRSVAAQNKRNVQPADSPEVIVIGKACV